MRRRSVPFAAALAIASGGCGSFDEQPSAAAVSPEGGSPETGAVDAGSAQPACGPKRLEDSFEGAAIGAHWLRRGHEATISLDLDGSERRTGSTSLRVDVGVSAAAFRFHSLELPLVGSGGAAPSCIHTRIALRVSSYPTADGIVVETIQLGPGAALHLLVGQGQQIELAEQAFLGSTQPFHTLGAFAVGIGTWAEAEVFVEGGATPKVRFRVNGSDVALARAPEFVGPPPTAVRVGAIVAKQWPAEYWIDDVLIE